ncbi:hypothetical protein CYY_007332 [Polysphondylium violaceum]|uniref:Transmembrane protein n=1 Tax=Polysphondylium violaceum TaxID=133409 RepID=A0A8J4UXS0_9MYCE|nr:hypothetical protein CYY_007332 [Polysphondylium violaceum]
MSETINNGSTSGTGNSLESISIDIPLSDVYQLEPQLLLKNRVESFTFLLIFLLFLLKTLYIYFIDNRLLKSRKPKKINNNNTEPEIKEQQNEIDLEENQFSVKNIEIEQETQIIEQQNEFDRSKSLSDQQP